MNKFVSLCKKWYYSSTPLRMFSYLVFPKSYTYSNLKIVIRDALKKENVENDLEIHIVEGMKWLHHAYEKGSPGSSGFYNMNLGWRKPYPETTGYIIETFLDYTSYLDKYNISINRDAETYFEAALDMADWLIDIQLYNGAFPGGLYSDTAKSPNVFNTGQILIGLLSIYEKTKNKKYLMSAKKAGDWLVEVQNKDGTWSNFTYEQGARSYHSRVSWPILILYKNTRDEKYKDAAIKNSNWVLKNQQENFWFERTNFFDADTSLTHTLAYTMRGLLESGIILGETKYIDAVASTAEKLMKMYEINSSDLLPAVFDKHWKSVAQYSCLTGCAQLSIIWSKLYILTEDIRYFNAALKINSALKRTQILGSYNSNVRGAIKGSQPVYGTYMPFSFPNWATKFYIDALLLEDHIMDNIYTNEMGEQK